MTDLRIYNPVNAACDAIVNSTREADKLDPGRAKFYRKSGSTNRRRSRKRVTLATAASLAKLLED